MCGQVSRARWRTERGRSTRATREWLQSLCRTCLSISCPSLAGSQADRFFLTATSVCHVARSVDPSRTLGGSRAIGRGGWCVRSHPAEVTLQHLSTLISPHGRRKGGKEANSSQVRSSTSWWSWEGWRSDCRFACRADVVRIKTQVRVSLWQPASSSIRPRAGSSRTLTVGVSILDE